MTIPAQAPVWDFRRNTSQQRPGSVIAEEAIEAIEAWRRAHPEHARWLELGAPPIQSQDEHVVWFGEPYPDRRRRR